MPEPMTMDKCREAQRDCSRSLYEKLDEFRREQRKDRDEMMEAIQTLGISVAQIKGYLRINGSSGLMLNPPHAHRRDDEPPKEHIRETDTLGGWVLKNLGWLIILGILMAALAGEKLTQHIPHP